MTTQEIERERGRLVTMPPGRLGMQQVNVQRCNNCGTDFTSTDYRALTINGVVNDGLCPWCRKDSKPWTNGRGL